MKLTADELRAAARTWLDGTPCEMRQWPLYDKDVEIACIACLALAEYFSRGGSVQTADAYLDRAVALGIVESDRSWYESLRRSVADRQTTVGTRFQPDPTSLAGFSDRVMVLCPKCGAPGLVTTGHCDSPQHWHRSSNPFRCSSCAFAAEPGQWFGPSQCCGSARCQWCGTKGIEAVSKQAAKSMRVACPACGRTTVVELVPKHGRDGIPRDPYFGMELRLRIMTRHGWLWAYNEQHLSQLRALVAAKQRLDTPGFTGGHSWANRLPSWVVSAKNRVEISRALDRCAQLLAT